MGDLGRLLDIDHAHVWHPYAPMPASAPALLVSAANGVRLILADGREVIDAMSSWWCAIHGYRHPALDGAARAQLESFSHVMFGGLTHAPGVLPEQLFAPRPPGGVDELLDAEWEGALRELFAHHGGELAAAIVEPVVQGAGGMWFYSPACLTLLRELCDEHGVLLIFDEIATGFGRAGTFFAAERAGVAPDVMCVGKALTGGYLTLAATLCTAAVARAIGGPLMHGPTFMGNPLACAVALANLELLASGEWREQVARAQRVLGEELAAAAGAPGVRDVRVLGAIAVIELDRDVAVGAATATALERGVWLRPFRNLVYAMPPYIAGEQELRAIGRAMVAAATGAEVADG